MTSRRSTGHRSSRGAAGQGLPPPGAGREGRRASWRRLLALLPGLLALVWVVLRVAPRPSRAAYPCQRVAMPLAGGLLGWLLAPAGAAIALRGGRGLRHPGRRRAALACAAVGLLLAATALLAPSRRSPRADDQVPNAPLGVARGIHPGRVVWVFDPAATVWDGPGDGHWWQDEHTSQAAVDRMLDEAVAALTGAATVAGAWDSLFHHFNRTHGRGDRGYAPGERIVVKTNFVGCHWLWGGVDPVTWDLTSQLDYMNTSPQVILALLRQLVGAAGVAQAAIAVGDPNGRFCNQYHDHCAADFPDVRYLDHDGGTAAHPRTRVADSDVVLHWSSHPAGVLADRIPQPFVDAAYVVDLANLKSHASAGVTLGAKNLYGALTRWPGQSGYYDLHPSLPASEPASGRYRALVDLLGCAHLGGKTVLALIDGLYAGVHPDDAGPRRWQAAPFDGGWTSSLLASQDPLALDSVGFDLLQLEGDPRAYPRMAGADDYLHEAALAGAPPSGTFYDPDHEGDVARLASLGVHEHWDGPDTRRYSRDLGRDEGIELVFRSFATAAVAPPPPAALRLRAGPNPFNPRLTLAFALPAAQRVRLEVFGVDGRRVAVLLDGSLPPGPGRVVWDGRGDDGRPAPSGVYLCRLSAGARTATTRVTLAR